MKDEPRVISARFEFPKTVWDGRAKAVLVMDDGTEDSLSYYHDEISFSERELVGKTMDECRRLWHEKDIAYLRS